MIIDLLPETERQSWHISEDLRSRLAELGIPQFQLSCFYKRHVFQALDWCLSRLKESNFILQFIAHGNTDGLGLKATKEFITWSEFRDHLKKINEGLGGDLVVSMIACQDIEGVAIQEIEYPSDPFFGIVGPRIKIGVEDAKRVSKQFYEKMRDGVEVPYIVRDINAEMSQQLLWCHSAQSRRKQKDPTLGL